MKVCNIIVAGKDEVGNVSVVCNWNHNDFETIVDNNNKLDYFDQYCSL